MVKIGDKVTLFRDMSKEGIVVELRQHQVKAWMVGGTTDKRFIATVKLNKDDTLQEYFVSDLMRLE